MGRTFKKNIGAANLKVVLIPAAAIAGLLLGAGLNQALHKATAEVSPQEKPAAGGLGNRIVRNADCPLHEGRRAESSEREFSGRLSSADPQSRLLRLKDYMKSLESKNTLFKEKADLLTSLLDSKEKELSKLNEYNISLKDNLDKAIVAQARLKADVDALNLKVSQKESEISILNTIRTGFENQLKEIKAAQADSQVTLEGQLSQTQQVKSSLETELVKAKEGLTQQISANDMLNKNIADLAETLNAKEKDRQSLASEVQQWQEAKKQLEAELAKLRSDKESFEAQVGSLTSRVNELSASYEDSRKSVLQLSSLITKKELERELAVSDKESELSVANTNLYKLSSEKDALAATLSEKDKAINELRGKLKEYESRITALQKEALLEKERQQQLAQQLERSKSLNESLKNRDKNVTNLANELQQWQEAKKKLEVELAKVRGEKLNLEVQVNDLNARVREMSATFTDSKKSLSQVNELLSKKESERDSVLSAKREEVAKMSVSVSRMAYERDELLVSLGGKDRIISELNAKVKDFEPRIAALQKALDETKDRQEETLRQLEGVKELNESLKARLKNIYLELEMLRAEKLNK